MPYAIPGAAFCVVLSLGLITRNFLLAWLRRRTAVVRSAELLTALWCVAAAAAFALPYMPIDEARVNRWEQWIAAFAIASVTLVAANVAARMVTVYGQRHVIPFAASGLAQTLVRLSIAAFGAMLLLRFFGYSITPLWTALGIGGLAVALALQDTLANFFAGVHILIETPITPGDHIRLSSGEEGVVTDIGWRTTRVLTGGHSTIVIPNTKITSGILTNFSLPNQRVTVEVPIYVEQGADVNRVAELALDTAAETAGVLRDPAPAVLFDPGMLPTHMEFKAVLHVEGPRDRGVVASEFRVRLLEKFYAAGIRPPQAERFMWSPPAARAKGAE